MKNFSGDILALVFSHVQLHEDVVTFRLVCKKWCTASQRPDAQRLREEKYRNTCAFLFSKFHGGHGGAMGEFRCEVCRLKVYCRFHKPKNICLRCDRRPGECCWRDEIPLCYQCAPEKCENHCGKSFMKHFLSFEYCPISHQCLCALCHTDRGCCWKKE